MGYLLKEALKTLCGINQWAYAVFWKIGQQNPKLLIWEEYYCGPESCSGLGGISQAGDKVHLLVNKMMMDHHVNIVGQGLIGRVSFTGSHQWIISKGCYGEAYPPEVLKEIYDQFSAGIQTIAVIPVLPHGVVQFGSYFNIMESMGFVHDVESLIHQLGHIPNVWLSDNHLSKELAPQIPLPESQMNSSPLVNNCFGYIENLNQNSSFESQPSYSLSGVFQNGTSDIKPCHINEAVMVAPAMKSEVIPPKSETWISQPSSPLDLKPVIDLPIMSQHNENLNIAEMFHGFMEDDIQHTIGSQLNSVTNFTFDDIFDNLSSGCNNFTSHESASDMHNNWDKSNSRSKTNAAAAEVIHSTTRDNLDSGIFSSICSDHLLDAVVSKAQPCTKEDSASCKTTLTNNISSCSSTTKVSLPYGRFGVSIHTDGSLSGITKYLAKDVGTSSQCSSIYDSSAQKDQNQTVSISSKKPPEPNKVTRKRLKPGENPRPRPKDRQMIQDRVKELREIVPNGAKCSIDALLERTIKHMLFLQSVTKHGDKLKRTVESKIIGNDGGLLLKDKFEGGATWAYEIGSNSMVCPIIVEDLNQPRQMLIEMLCEERGSFLEIADIVRGLGLTILKGTMETRNEKIWSRFVVEANRDVTRMEIFISLVRILEQGTKKGDTMITVPQFHQASIPATGEFRNLH